MSCVELNSNESTVHFLRAGAAGALLNTARSSQGLLDANDIQQRYCNEDAVKVGIFDRQCRDFIRTRLAEVSSPLTLAAIKFEHPSHASTRGLDVSERSTRGLAMRHGVVGSNVMRIGPVAPWGSPATDLNPRALSSRLEMSYYDRYCNRAITQ